MCMCNNTHSLCFIGDQESIKQYLPELYGCDGNKSTTLVMHQSMLRVIHNTMATVLRTKPTESQSSLYKSVLKCTSRSLLLLRFQVFSSKLLDQDDYILQFIPVPFACFNNNLWNSSGKISSGQIFIFKILILKQILYQKLRVSSDFL